MKSSLKRLLTGFWCLIILLLGSTGAFGAFGMPVPAQIALSILIIAATLWISEAVPLFVTSFAVLFMALVWLTPEINQFAVLRGETAIEPVTNANFLTPFFSNIILLFLGGFVISAALHEYHLDEQLAGFILKQTGRSVPRLMLGVMGVTAFLSMWLSNTATAAMMLALVLPIVRSLPAGDASRKGIVLSIPFAANVGGLGTPIGSPPNAIGMKYMRDAGVDPTFIEWMAIGVPGVVLMLAVSWMLLLVLYRGQKELSDGNERERPEFHFTPGTWVVLSGSIVTAIGWMTSGLHGIASGTIGLIPLLLFFGTRTISAKLFRTLPWDVLFLMGGGLCLGECVSASGLANWIVTQLPIRGASPYMLMVIFGSVAVVMSCIMSNTATANLIMPIALGLEQVDALDPILVGVAFACSLAMALPISTPPNAMAFSSGELSVSDLLVPGTIVTLVGMLTAYTIGYWWWGIIGIA